MWSNTDTYIAMSVLGAAGVLGQVISDNDEQLGIVPIIVNIANSSTYVLVMLNFVAAMFLVVGKLIQHIFFGQLRQSEEALLRSRLSSYAIYKFMFLVAVIEYNPKEYILWMFWFGLLGFLKMLGNLARDRFEHLSLAINTPRRHHMAVVTVLVGVLVCDLMLFFACYMAVSQALGLSMFLLMTFESFIIAVATIQTLCKYALHLYDMSREGLWEHRGTAQYYVDFGFEMMQLTSTLAHYVHIVINNGLNLGFVDLLLFTNIRNLYNNVRSRYAAYRNYREAMNNLNTRYPDATPEDLAARNDDCAICRDSMTSGKKLSCGHIFHFSCLRSWLEQQSTCPTCRMSLADGRPQAVPAPAHHGHAHPHPHPAAHGVAPMPGAAMAPGAEGAAAAGAQAQPGQAAQGRPGHGHTHNNAGFGQHRQMFRFDSPAWAGGWLPNISVNVSAQTAVQFEQMGVQVHEMFPHIPLEAIMADLQRTMNAEGTIENILNGRVQVAPVPRPTAAAPATPATPSTPAGGAPTPVSRPPAPSSTPVATSNAAATTVATPSSATAVPIFPRASPPAPISTAAAAATPTAAVSVPATPPSAGAWTTPATPTSAPPMASVTTPTAAAASTPRSATAASPMTKQAFATSPEDRQNALARRKQELIEATRQKYLEKQAKQAADARARAAEAASPPQPPQPVATTTTTTATTPTMASTPPAATSWRPSPISTTPTAPASTSSAPSTPTVIPATPLPLSPGVATTVAGSPPGALAAPVPAPVDDLALPMDPSERRRLMLEAAARRGLGS